MVFRYIRPCKLSAFSAEKFYKKYRIHDAHKTGQFHINAEKLVDAARDRGLHSALGRVSTEMAILQQQVAWFILEAEVPLIICQSQNAESLLGHFRVVVGLNPLGPLIHDPCPKSGGSYLQFGWEQLYEDWRTRNSNVTGGVALWFHNSPIDDKLAPLTPNFWAMTDPNNGVTFEVA